MRKKRSWGWIALILFLVLFVVFGIPQVRDRVFAQVDELLIRARAALFPVQEVAFVPGGVKMSTPTLEQPTTTVTPIPLTATPTVTPLIPLPTFTPTATLTALPPSANLKGVRWENQNGAWNYCAPTNLSMLLSFWGWKGDKMVTGKFLKPYDYDLNVMPYEMADFITQKTDLGVVVRMGGTQTLLKLLIANGFPVLIEKGVFFTESSTGITSWMGHYQVLTGYDDVKKQFIAQDSFIRADYPMPYDLLESEWRAFNFTFLVAYSKDRQEKVNALLGDYADETRSAQIAYRRASEEVQKLQGADLYFAWFNRGTSQVSLKDYAGAGESYDTAFKVYPSIAEDKRPWRMLWYQTGPYFAYFYSGRYQDVVNLATNTLDFIKKRAERLGIDKLAYVGPFIEETWLWRARARIIIGDRQGAIDDLKMALKYHTGWVPALDEMKKLGVPVN